MTTDEQLLKRIENKEKRALELMINRYHLLLWRLCWELKSDPVMNEQLITQVFQLLWEEPRTFSGEKKFLFMLIKRCKEQLAAREEGDGLKFANPKTI